MSDEDKIIKSEEEIKKEAEDATKPKLAVQIFIMPDGQCEMKTSMLAPMVVWMFLQLIFLMIAKNLGYISQNENKIIPPKHGIMDFVRRRFK